MASFSSATSSSSSAFSPSSSSASPPRALFTDAAVSALYSYSSPYSALSSLPSTFSSLSVQDFAPSASASSSSSVSSPSHSSAITVRSLTVVRPFETKTDETAVRELFLNSWGVYRRRNAFMDKFHAASADSALKSDLAGIASHHQRPGSEFFVATASDQIVGCVSVQQRAGGRSAELIRMAVREDARRCGIGRKLVEACVQFCRQQGYPRLFSQTLNEDWMDLSNKLYLACGFQLLRTDHIAIPYIDPVTGMSVKVPINFYELAIRSHQSVAAEISTDGKFVRQQYQFRGRITADGSSGFLAEPNRYHLYVSRACPWAHRAIIVRYLMGLEDVISMTVVDPFRDAKGWAFRDGPGHTVDRVNGFAFLSEAYLRTDPNYNARFTVPCIWDCKTQKLLSNNFPDITLDMETQFLKYAKPVLRNPLYPAPLRAEIDWINELVYQDVNDGVYKAGFATSQEAYDEPVSKLFTRLDWLEKRLANQRYLVGAHVTEADIRLFVTLVRFDTVYYIHFKCCQRRLVDYPNLWAYVRELYQMPGFGSTTNFDHIKTLYYTTHPQISPARLVPKGPIIDWMAPHDRARFEVVQKTKSAI